MRGEDKDIEKGVFFLNLSTSSQSFSLGRIHTPFRADSPYRPADVMRWSLYEWFEHGVAYLETYTAFVVCGGEASYV